MAINYLNSIDLNRNELQDAQLIRSQVENQPNDAAVGGTPVEGQLYFNTSDDVLKVYANGAWVEVGGGVETLTTTDGTYIDLTPNSATAGAVTVTADLNALDGSSGASERYLTKSNVWAEISTIPGTYSWEFDGDSGATQTVVSGNTVSFEGGIKITTLAGAGDVLEIKHDLQTQTDSTSAASPAAGATFTVVDSVTRDTTGHATGLNVKTITLPPDTNTQTTYTLPVSVGTAPSGYSVADINLTAGGAGSGVASTVTFKGENNNILITKSVGNNGSVIIALTDDVVIDNNLTLAGEISQTSTGNENVFASTLNMSSKKITNVLDPTSAQDAATKQYVDDATVGGLIYQGAYNASTNTPDLDSASSIAVEKGWTYTVTVAGLFFTEQVRVGDVLIAEVDQASGAGALANWTTVQNNIDLASSIQVGIGNVIAATDDEMLGIDVTYNGSGTAEVGLAISDMTAVTTTQDASLIPIFDEDDGANRKISVGNLALAANSGTTDASGAIAIGDLVGTATHNFGTKNTIVQTIDQNGDTVFCDITRTTNTCVATIATAQTAATGGIITILVQKIG